MSLIKRFSLKRVESEAETLPDGSPTSPVLPQEPVAPGPQEQEKAVEPTTVEPLSAPQSDGGVLKQMKESGIRQKASHRAALDFLNILKSLAPVFKAATIYPGHEAPADQIAVAVRLTATPWRSIPPGLGRRSTNSRQS
jgi:hypothetical protein